MLHTYLPPEQWQRPAHGRIARITTITTTITARTVIGARGQQQRDARVKHLFQQAVRHAGGQLGAQRAQGDQGAAVAANRLNGWGREREIVDGCDI